MDQSVEGRGMHMRIYTVYIEELPILPTIFMHITFSVSLANPFE